MLICIIYYYIFTYIIALISCSFVLLCLLLSDGVIPLTYGLFFLVAAAVVCASS